MLTKSVAACLLVVLPAARGTICNSTTFAPTPQKLFLHNPFSRCWWQMNIDLVGLVGLIFAFSNTLVYQMIAAMVYRTVCIRCREDDTDSDARFDRRTPFPIVFIMVAAAVLGVLFPLALGPVAAAIAFSLPTLLTACVLCSPWAGKRNRRAIVRARSTRQLMRQVSNGELMRNIVRGIPGGDEAVV